jgi:hypothetical protein
MKNVWLKKANAENAIDNIAPTNIDSDGFYTGSITINAGGCDTTTFISDGTTCTTGSWTVNGGSYSFVDNEKRIDELEKKMDEIAAVFAKQKPSK